MTILLVQRWRLVQIVEFPVDFYTLKALLAQFNKFFAELNFSVPNDRSQQIGTRPLLHLHHAVYHILDLLGLDWLTSCRGIRRADAGKQKTHIIVDFSDGTNGRAWIFRSCLLFNRNRGA